MRAFIPMLLVGVLVSFACVMEEVTEQDLRAADGKADTWDSVGESGTTTHGQGCHESAGVAPFELAEDYCITWRTSLSASSNAVSMAGPTTLRGFEFQADRLVEVEVDPVEGMETSREEFSIFAPSLGGENVKIFPSTFVAVGTDSATAVGYNISAASDHFDGEILVWPPQASAPLNVPARGNYGAAWLSPGQLLVNGLGLADVNDGQGVYAVTVTDSGAEGAKRLVANLGHRSGFLARSSTGIVLAGGYGNWGEFLGSRVYAFTVDELQAAAEEGVALDAEADGDLVFERPPRGEGSGQSIAIVGNTMYVVFATDRGVFESILAVPLGMTDDGVITAGPETPVLWLPEGSRAGFALDLSAHEGRLGVHALIDRSTAYLVLQRRAEEPPATTWQGLSVQGEVGQDQEMRFETPLLPAGTYDFTMTGDNDADLYVGIGSAPTVEDFICRPFSAGSEESCSGELTAPGVIHLMVRGYSQSSTFELTGQQR